MAARKEIPREISIYINDVAVVNSFAGINRAIGQTNNEIRNLNRNSATYDEDLRRLQTTLGGLRERQAEFREEINETNVSASKAKEAFSKMFTGLASGDLATAKEGFEEIKGSIGGMVKSALAFIATPLGATIAVLAGISMVVKSWWDYNESIRENTRLIENLTGKTGQAVADIRNNIQGLANTFGLEFEGLANAVDNLMDTGVAKNELEALDKIKNGLLTAPNKNEFIASLESTALTAKQVGLSLEEVIALKQAIEDTGVDPEASFGALQKAAKNLSQQSATLKKQMQDALGAGFADDILAKVKSGEITISQALIAIGEKARESGLNQKQQMDLTVSLLGKQGLAAGGLLTITKELTDAQNSQSKALTPLQQATKELADSEIALQKAQDDVLRSEGFDQWKTRLLVTFNEVKKGFYDVVYEITNGFGSVEDKIKQDTAANSIKEYADQGIKTFEDYANRRKISMGAAYDFEKVKEEHLASLRQGLSNGWDDTEEQVQRQKKLEAEIDALVKYKGKESIVRKAATADEIRDAKSAADKIAATKKTIDDKKKAAQEKHDKELWDKAIALAKAKTDLAKTELDYFISNNRSKIDNTKQLTPEIIAEETKRLDEIKSKQNQALDDKIVNDKKALDNNSKQELAELKKLLTDKIISKSEFNQLEIQNKNILIDGLKSIDLEYETAKQNLEFQFSESTTSLKKEYIEQQKQLEIEQLQAQNELDILEADSKLQADRVKQAQDYKIQLAGYKKLFDDKKITQIQYDRFLAASKKEQEALDRVAKLQQLNGTLGGLNQIAGALGDMFGQSKALSIAQAGINGAMAVTSILAQYPKYDGGFAMWASIAAAGITTIAQVGKIASAKAPATPKFFYGGFNNSNGAGGSTGTTAHLGTDEFGKITGVTHDEEWVAPKIMTQSPKYAATFSWLESERKGILGNKHFNGGETSTGTVAPFTETSTQNNGDILAALNRLNDHLDRGIKAEAIIGYKKAKEIDDLNKERDMSNKYGIISE